jgi:hypothetical protein
MKGFVGLQELPSLIRFRYARVHTSVDLLIPEPHDA